VRALVAAGAVSVDGAVLRGAGRPLRAGQRVHALVRVEELQPATAQTDRPFALTASAILYRDRWLIAVDKPAGLPTHATADLSRPSLVGHVEALLRAEGLPAYVAVHQRLDRDTTGVVLFATDAEANAGLARAFAGREVEKEYVALTARPRALPRRRFALDAPLDGKPARTEVVVREPLAGALLVEARPRSGRRHQVRRHLAQAGLPVLGDADQDVPAEALAVPRLMLHARSLALVHPLAPDRPLRIESPLPADFVAALAAARRRRG
jgi:23S rRNA-/tRNA-specific pseudouridylate synthase